MNDLTVARAHEGKFRKDWGTQNPIGIPSASPHGPPTNAARAKAVHDKLAAFISTAIYPQQLTIPRQYATTREGCFIFRILEGRLIDGIREDGVRVVVQENLRNARFVISPLFRSKHDALTWARQHMGAEV